MIKELFILTLSVNPFPFGAMKTSVVSREGVVLRTTDVTFFKVFPTDKAVWRVLRGFGALQVLTRLANIGFHTFAVPRFYRN